MSRKRHRRPIEGDYGESYAPDTPDQQSPEAALAHAHVRGNWQYWIGSGLGIAGLIFVALMIAVPYLVPNSEGENGRGRVTEEQAEPSRELSLRDGPGSDQTENKAAAGVGQRGSANDGQRTPPAMASSMPQLAIPAGPNDPWAGSALSTGRSQLSSTGTSPPAITPPIVSNSQNARLGQPRQFPLPATQPGAGSALNDLGAPPSSSGYGAVEVADPFWQRQSQTLQPAPGSRNPAPQSTLEQPLPAIKPRSSTWSWTGVSDRDKPAGQPATWDANDRNNARSRQPAASSTETTPPAQSLVATNEPAASSTGTTVSGPSWPSLPGGVTAPSSDAVSPPQVGALGRPASTAGAASSSPSTSWGRQPLYQPRGVSSTRSYTVQPGESVFDIARSQLGRADRWVEIVELNRTTFRAGPSSLEQLAPGTSLLLPANDSSRLRP